MIAMTFLMAMTAATHVGSSELTTLDHLRWERRVILVFASEESRAPVLASLRKAEASLEDREITWFLLVPGASPGESAISNHDGPVAADLVKGLRRALAPIGDPLDVLLIGKDGGLKDRSDTLDLERLFDQVDGMPMRQRELCEREQAEATAEAASEARP